jgi:GTP-binding protein Era
LKAGFVSLIGRPNAGKSTLLNRLVGTKLAIVSDKPQTTRTRILGVRNYTNRGSAPDPGSPTRAPRAAAARGTRTRQPRWRPRPGSVARGDPSAPLRSFADAQVVFLDTPGIHRPLHRMNVRMVDAAVETMRDVDVLGVVIDAAEPVGRGDRFVLDLVKDAAPPVFAILNKIDLMKKPRLLPLIQQYSELGRFAEIIPVSAATGDNVDRLERAIVDRLPEGDPLYPADFLTDQPERFFAAEIVREKLLQLTHAEIPFSSAVVVDRFEEPEADRGVLRLFCTIVVDRESHKPIVLGRGGARIKQIGTAAREDLERFFKTRVFLDLHVRVKSEWREDERVLNELGLK